MATAPQMIGYSLVDPPAWLPTWVLEKFFEYVDIPSMLLVTLLIVIVGFFALPTSGVLAILLAPDGGAAIVQRGSIRGV
ncbi:hypothetical protein [Microbacterium sp. SLBN-111]|uniref:hypothetical protein n=1 Tax=Microbacterium sp. SLBN-111 TaxID=3377733 RepID=UPI003C758E81